MSQQADSRRKFLKLSFAGVFACALGQRVIANSRTLLGEDDPMAMALGYVADVDNTDAQLDALYKKGNNCANCLQFKNIDEAGVGDCSIFPGKGVPSNAWCKAWVGK